MEELIKILTDIRDEKDVSGNSAYKIGDALLRIRQCLADTEESLDSKIETTDNATSIIKDDYQLGITSDGKAVINGNGITEELFKRKNFMAQNIAIKAEDLIKESDGLWTTPPIQLLVGNAQIQIASDAQTTVTVARSNSPTSPFAVINGWNESPAVPIDVFNISGGVAGMYIKLKFSVKPISISVLS